MNQNESINNTSEFYASDPIISDLRSLDELKSYGLKEKFFRLNSALDGELSKLATQDWAVSMSQGTLINLAILRLINDVKGNKVGFSINLKNRLGD